MPQNDNGADNQGEGGLRGGQPEAPAEPINEWAMARAIEKQEAAGQTTGGIFFENSYSDATFNQLGGLENVTEDLRFESGNCVNPSTVEYNELNDEFSRSVYNIEITAETDDTAERLLNFPGQYETIIYTAGGGGGGDMPK